MYVKNLQVKNYRNYDDININLNNSLNIFLGENAQGKTNLAEAIYFLSSLKSHRTSKNKDIIKWDTNSTYIKGTVSRLYGDDTLEVFISSVEKNYIKVNGVKATKASEVLGRLNVVMFSPEDLKLVKEGPNVRRKFLDFELSQIRPKYHYLIGRYNKILNQRNNILKSLQFSNGSAATLDVFTEQLIEAACEIVIMRHNFINEISVISKAIHEKITMGLEDLDIGYVSDVTKFDSKDKIKEQMYEKINKKRDFEIKKGYTLIGPHRDDIMIKINSIDVRSFGSQGQQRSAALSLKLSEIDIINKVTGEYPVLILDDVLSELDKNRQRYLIDNLSHVQTILTCTSGSDVNMFETDIKNVYLVNKGKLLMGQ